jgi:helix-turn-helix protein
MEFKRSYYAVIPAIVRYDKKIIPNAKLLYGEITALCNEKGYCWATNKYFADLYGVDPRSIRSWVQSLVSQGYIRVEITNEVDRKIFILEVGQFLPGGRKKSSGGVGRNIPHNNTVNNTIIDIAEQSSAPAKKPKKEQKPVIQYTKELLEEKLCEMEKMEGSYLDIIATYIREKPVHIENSKQLSLVITRFCRIAKSAEGAYTNKQIFSTINEIKKEYEEDKRKGKTPIDWTVETIIKKLVKK